MFKHKKFVVKRGLFILFLFVFLSMITINVNAKSKTEIVETTDDIGWDSSIALDSSGYSHIVHIDRNNIKIWYCNNTAGSWSCETVSTGWNAPEIAIDSNDKMHTIHYDDAPGLANRNLVYCNNTAGSWSCENISSVGNYLGGMQPSIAIDSNDKIHTTGFNGWSLEYCTDVTDSWVCEEVEVADFAATYSSIAINSSNDPHIVYYDWGTPGIKHCDKVAGSWNCNLIEKSITYPSIAIDSNDIIHISAYNSSYKDIIYYNNSGGSWENEIVDSGNSGGYTSITIDSTNNPHIVHYDDVNEDLRYCDNVKGWNCLKLEDADGESLGDGTGRNLAIKKGRIIDSTSFSDYAHISWYKNTDLIYTEKLLNITNITIISNLTLPTTPAIDDVVFVNVELNETLGYEIIEVNFTITPPNGTTIYSNINGTYTKPDANDLFYYNWSSQSFIIDDGGTWTWEFIAKNNASIDYAEATGTGSFIILDTTAPTILGIDSPTNDTEYILTSDIDINVTWTDDMRGDYMWFNIVNGSKPSQILQANTSFTYCGSRICGNNISQFSFPIVDNMTVNVYANDTSGNEVWGQIIKLNVTIDTSKPDVSLDSISDKAASYSGCPSTVIDFTFTNITDNGEVDTVWFNVYKLVDGIPTILEKANTSIVNNGVNSTTITGCATYFLSLYANDTENNEDVDSDNFTISYTAPPPPPPSRNGKGGGAGAPTCPEGELYDPLLFKCVPIIKLPENASNLTLTPSRLDKPSVAFTLITEDEALFKQDFKSNFRLSTVEVISGDFNVTLRGNTTIRLSYLLDKKENWGAKLIEGSFSATDIFGRTVFIDNIRVTIYNPAYRVIGIIPVWAFAPIVLIVIIVFYKKRKGVILSVKNIVKNVYTKIFG